MCVRGRSESSNLYWFSLVTDELTKGMQGKVPWRMTFVDDVVLTNENTNTLKSKLGRWTEILEKNRLQISRSKTKLLEFRFKNEIDGNGSGHNVRLGG